MTELPRDEDMPCDCCGAESGESRWVGTEAGVVPSSGMFLCPLCDLRSPEEQFELMLRAARREVVKSGQ